MTQSVGPKRVHAMQRHRRNVEQLIFESLPDDDSNRSLDAWGFGRTFDVHAAREYGRSLVALADEQEVFEDWTRDLGLGPENRIRGTFDSNWSSGFERGEDIEACDVCDGRGVAFFDADCPGGCYFGAKKLTHRGGWPGKLSRAYAKTGAKRSAAAGKTLARLGQRLLDMLDGRCSWAPSAPVQPSECQACTGTADTFDDALAAVHRVARSADMAGDTELQPLVVGRQLYERLMHTRAESDYSQWRIIEAVSESLNVGLVVLPQCNDCRGTGHNLAGVVPPIEWIPALRRRLADMPEPGPVPPEFDGDDWIDRLIRDGGEALLDARDTPLMTMLLDGTTLTRDATRVVPRGEHISMGHDPETAPDLCRVRKLKRGGHKLDDLSGHTKPVTGLPWAIDNGAWACHVAGKAWLEEPFVRLLARAVELEQPSFAVLPDIVAGGADSLAFSIAWWKQHRNGLAAAASPNWLLAVQDGMTVLEVRRALERHRIGGIFVGGSAGPGTPMWKWRTVHDWAELGLELGVRVHVGRVNGERRAALCRDLGVTSIDGSAVSRFAVNGTKMGRSCDGTEPVHPAPGHARGARPAALAREIAELEPVARHTIAKRRFQLALDAIDP